MRAPLIVNFVLFLLYVVITVKGIFYQVSTCCHLRSVLYFLTLLKNNFIKKEFCNIVKYARMLKECTSTEQTQRTDYQKRRIVDVRPIGNYKQFTFENIAIRA